MLRSGEHLLYYTSLAIKTTGKAVSVAATVPSRIARDRNSHQRLQSDRNFPQLGIRALP